MRKELRLKKPSEFKVIFKEGKRFFSPHFVLFMRNSGLPAARLGVSISKRHFKLATTRNRLRRVAKEFFREEISPNFKGCDFVIASKANFPHKNVNDIAKEVKNLIKDGSSQPNIYSKILS